MKLTKAQVLQVPKLKTQGMTDEQVASKLKVSVRTVQYWIGKLREAGHKVPRAKRASLDLS